MKTVTAVGQAAITTAAARKAVGAPDRVTAAATQARPGQQLDRHRRPDRRRRLVRLIRATSRRQHGAQGDQEAAAVALADRVEIAASAGAGQRQPPSICTVPITAPATMGVNNPRPSARSALLSSPAARWSDMPDTEASTTQSMATSAPAHPCARAPISETASGRPRKPVLPRPAHMGSAACTPAGHFMARPSRTASSSGQSAPAA